MPFSSDDEHFMREALAFARIAYAEQEVPIGAVVVRGGRMIGRGRNRRERLSDPTHHAEIEAIREAAHDSGSWRLEDATLYATVEPCAMCAGAAVNARIARIVFGCADPKAGYCGTLGNIPQDPRLNHRCVVEGGPARRGVGGTAEAVLPGETISRRACGGRLRRGRPDANAVGLRKRNRRVTARSRRCHYRTRRE